MTVLRGHRREVLCVRAAGEARLVSSSDDRTVKIWDTRAEKASYSMGGAHSGSIYCVLPNAFGREHLIVSGGADGKGSDAAGSAADTFMVGCDGGKKRLVAACDFVVEILPTNRSRLAILRAAH